MTGLKFNLKKYLKLINYPLSEGEFELSSFCTLSFLNSNFPNFHVKLSPIERKGIVRIWSMVNSGPKTFVFCTRSL